MFYKLGVLKNFAKIPGKTPVLETHLNALAGLKPVTTLKMTPAQVFSCELVEILRKSNTSRLKSNMENTYVGDLFQ